MEKDAGEHLKGYPSLKEFKDAKLTNSRHNLKEEYLLKEQTLIVI